MKCLPCEECGKPVSPADLPVVLEWGEKPKGQPDFIGKPWKRVVHNTCDKTAKSPARKAKQTEEKTTKGNAAPKAPRESAGKLVGKIYRLVKGNPRKEGTHGHHSYSLIKDGMTVEAYLAAGGRNNDLRWDVDHKFVEVK